MRNVVQTALRTASSQPAWSRSKDPKDLPFPTPSRLTLFRRTCLLIVTQCVLTRIILSWTSKTTVCGGPAPHHEGKRGHSDT